VDALPVGAGRLDLGVLLRGGHRESTLGAFVDYERRKTEHLSLFGVATAGVLRRNGHTSAFAEANAGLRMRW